MITGLIDLTVNLDTGNEEVMNQIAIPIRDDTVCQQHFQGYLPNTEICAGMENSGKDWCVVSCFLLDLNNILFDQLLLHISTIS